jgi:hypothetical protein
VIDGSARETTEEPSFPYWKSTFLENFFVVGGRILSISRRFAPYPGDGDVMPKRFWSGQISRRSGKPSLQAYVSFDVWKDAAKILVILFVLLI